MTEPDPGRTLALHPVRRASLWFAPLLALASGWFAWHSGAAPLLAATLAVTVWCAAW